MNHPTNGFSDRAHPIRDCLTEKGANVATKHCEECGREFEIKWPHNPNRFCSYSCRSIFNSKHLPTMQASPPIIVPCDECGKPVHVTKWQNENYATHSCSARCKALIKARTKGRSHPLFKEKIKMSCKVCGKVCEVKPSLVTQFAACSKHCAAVWGHKLRPRISSIEVAFGQELQRRGVEFRPQEIIGRHIVDFYVPSLSLAIECDGSYWHALPKTKARDKIKDQELAALGVSLIRIPEEMIKAGTEAAVDHALTPPLAVS